jgi:high-affinity iron transporter
MTDAELDASLAASIPDAAARAREVARLRAVAPFEPATGHAAFEFARRSIREARDAAARGDRAKADRLVLDAYIRGVEEVEAPLRACDPELVVEVEEAIRRLRTTIAEGSPAAATQEADAALALLERAEAKSGSSPLGGLALVLEGALLVLREGLEAALIIAAILAAVRRAGFGGAPRAVHAGWIAALFAGGLTYAVVRSLLTSLTVNPEALEAGVTLVAAALLFATSFWLISKADARHWIAYVKARAGASAAEGERFGLFLVAFLAAYRETFETVLFFEGFRGGVAGRTLPLAAGAVLGAGLLALAVVAIGRVQMRLPLGPFFAASGALLSALSIVLLGEGLHALEGSSLLVPRPIALPRVEWLGLYPDAISAGAQAAMLVAVVAATVVMRLRARAETPRGA